MASQGTINIIVGFPVANEIMTPTNRLSVLSRQVSADTMASSFLNGFQSPARTDQPISRAVSTMGSLAANSSSSSTVKQFWA